MQCLRATNASSLAHQITNSSVHSFYAAGSIRQIQFWIFAIGSEMVDPPEKLPNDHAHDAQSCCLANKVSQFFEHGLQPGAIGELQSLADILVKRFAQGSACQVAIASASAVLQSADEMKMAELYDPALAGAEPDNSGNLVGDRGPDASVYVGGDRRECLRPALHVLSARQQNRIEEDGSILMARLDRHHIQDPIFSSKAEVKSVQDQNQGSSWQSQNARSEHKPPQRLTPTVSHRLLRKARARHQTLQGSSLHQNGVQQTGRISPTLATSFLSADAPRPLATAALTTSRTEAMYFRSATRRFRVQRIHARELSTDWRSKYGKSRSNFAQLSTEFFCLNQTFNLEHWHPLTLQGLARPRVRQRNPC
jgi:hypothetical protein